MIRKKLMRLVLALVLVQCTVAAMCSGVTQTQLDKAASTSDNMARYTGETITLVKQFYDAGSIPLAVKDKLADLLIKFSKGGSDFNQLVKLFSDQYKSSAVPASVWAQITTQFDAVTALFLQILDLIPQAAGLKDSKAFKTVSAAILAIAQILMNNGKLTGDSGNMKLARHARRDARRINARLTLRGVSIVGVEV